MKKLLFIILFLFNLTWLEGAQAQELIAYSHFTGDYWQIWVMEPDGNNKKQITVSESDKRDPTWINQGEGLAFRTNNGELFTIRLDGSEETRHLEKYGIINNPHFLSSTNEVVFVRFDPRGSDLGDIWLAQLDGSESQVLTRDNVLSYQPRFSPDGAMVAFVRADRGTKNHQLWLMDREGNNRSQLTRQDGLHTLPEFSPDGESIYFTSSATGNYEIFTYQLSDRKIQQITNHPGLDTGATVSLDGKRMAFVSNRSGSQQIWVMGTDGSSPVQVIFDDYESVDPEWGSVKE